MNRNNTTNGVLDLMKQIKEKDEAFVQMLNKKDDENGVIQTPIFKFLNIGV